MPEESDQVVDDTLEEEQGVDEQSEESEEDKPQAEDWQESYRALQKGYTQTRQDLQAIRQSIDDLANRSNPTEYDEDEPLTAKKIEEIITKRDDLVRQKDQQLQAQIDDQLEQLRIDGIVKNKADEDALMQFAVDNQETDLIKAARFWSQIKLNQNKKEIDKAKIKAKQEEGSKIGSSQKAGVPEGGKVDYNLIRNKSMFDL